MPDDQDIIRIATRTQLCDYKLWGFGEAVAMNALLKAAHKTRVPDLAHFVYRCMDLWMSEYPDNTSPSDHVAPGVALLDLYEERGERRLLDRAKGLVDHLLSAPRSASGVHMHVAGRPYGVYVDCMYTDGPLLSRFANVTGDRQYHGAAVDYVLKQIEALQDPDDLLFYHGRDERSQKRSRYAWGRGTGWALMGLVDLLIELPEDIEGRGQIQATLNGLVEKLVTLQDRSGHWHTVLDLEDSYLEPSVAAMFTYAVQKAIDHEVLPPTCRSTVKLAWKAVQRNMQPGGRYPGSDGTDIGDFCHYNSVPLTINAWCTGPALLAACRMIEG